MKKLYLILIFISTVNISNYFSQAVNYTVRVAELRAQGDNNDGGGLSGQQDPTWYVWAKDNSLVGYAGGACKHTTNQFDAWWNLADYTLITGSNSVATQITIDMECWEEDGCGSDCSFDPYNFWGGCLNGDDNKANRAVVSNINFRNDPACQWNVYDVFIDGAGSLPDYGYYYARIEIKWEYANFNAGNDVSVCDSTVNLAATGNGTWAVSSGTGGSFSNNSDPNSTFNGQQGQTYTLTWQTLSGCLNSTNLDSVIVDVFSSPSANLTSTADSICEGDSVTFTAQNGLTYDWQLGINGSSLQSGSNNTFSSSTMLQGDSIYVTISDGNSCTGTDYYVIDVSPLPILNLVNDTTICANNTLNIDGTTPFVTYLWNTGEISSSINVSNAGTYSLIVENTYACSATDSIVVDTFTSPIVDMGPDTTICENNPILIDAGSNFASYLWSDGNTNQTNSISTFGTHWVNIIDTNGCVAGDTIYLTPIINNFQIGNDTTIYMGASINLTASGGASYLWDNGDTTSSIIVSPNIETTYQVTVYYSNGCYDIGTITVYVNDELNIFIPNMFSPNGDGANDYLMMYGYGFEDDIRFKIYNRWGEVVYKADDLSELHVDSGPTSGWDGKHNNIDQPTGVYIWTLEATDLSGNSISLEKFQKGSILLKR